jgi:PD-(D/E)XK endonuclease
MRPSWVAFSFSGKFMNPDIPHPKARGEWAELRFMARAAEHRLCVAKPWGDMAPYDFAVEHHGRFLRVQVKCTRYQRGHSYKCNITSNGTPYARSRLDFIAAYVIPADTWYIIPVRATHGQTQILLSPHRKHSKYDRYREAWHLLRASSFYCPWRSRCLKRLLARPSTQTNTSS